MDICTAGWVALLYVGSIQTGWHQSADLGGPAVEAQTCVEGLGGRVAFGQEWIQVGPQWGKVVELGDGWSLVGQVHGGLGYSNTFHPESHLRQVTLFNGGVVGMLEWKGVGLRLGYDHMSNGSGLNVHNVGQDMWSVGVGLRW